MKFGMLMGAAAVSALVFSFLGALAAPAHAQQRPEALERAVQHRQQIKTARLELAITEWNRPNVPPGRTRFVTMMAAPGEYAEIDRGDADGVVQYAAEGGPHPVFAKMQRLAYRAEGIDVRRDGDLLRTVEVSRTRSAPPDIRSLGFASIWPAKKLETTVFSGIPGGTAPRYATRQEADLQVVTVERDAGSIDYWLDPAKGYAATRVRQVTALGWYEARVELAQVGDIWFPRSVEMYTSTFQDGATPTNRVEVRAAEFNAPDHPTPLTAQSIGCIIGMTAELREPDNPGKQVGFWDGQIVVSPVEFSERVKSGELAEGARLWEKIRLSAALAAVEEREKLGDQLGRADPAATAARRDVKSFESEWERYTRAFIARYDLGDDQTQRALLLLKQCQEQGNSYLARQSREFEALDRRLNALADNRGKGSPPDVYALRMELQKELARLAGPIDAIFVEKLKPGLEKLPTRAQRARGGAAQSQPADEKP